MRQAGRKKMEELLKVSLLSLLHGCSGLQWVVVCSSVWVLQWVAVGCSGLWCAVVCVCCSGLQWVAVGCGVQQSCSSHCCEKEPPLSSSKSPTKETIFCKRAL